MTNETTEDMTAGAEAENLRASAELLSTLLLREVEPTLILELEESGARDQLQRMGLVIPEANDHAAHEGLAAEYFESFVKPIEMAPLIQSLVEDGAFEGRAARSMREIATSAGLEFDPKAARGAPADHLGSQIAMWTAIDRRDPATAREFASRHLSWALPELERRRDDSFYGRLSGFVADFIRVIDPS